MHGLFNKSKTEVKEAGFPESVLEHILPGRVLAVIGLREADVSNTLSALDSLMHDPSSIGFASARLKCAKVVRERHLFEHLTILENVCLPKLPFWSRRTAQTKQCLQLFERFEIKVDPFAKMDAYSYEEYKLIELVRAFLQKPDILILSDMLSDLGFIASISFLKILQAFREEGCRIVYFCTHWEESLRIGDSFSVIANGSILDEVYSAREIKENPRKIVYLLSGMDGSGSQGEDDESIRALSSIYKSSELFVKDYELNNTLAYLAASINSTMHASFSMIYIQDANGQTHSFSSQEKQKDRYLLSDSFRSYIMDGRNELLYYFKKDFEQKGCFVTKNEAETVLCLRFDAGSTHSGILEIVYDSYYIATEKQYLILNTFCNEVALLIETSHLFNQSVLLRESHHRIKNNLQIIVSIIHNQKMHFRNDPENTDYMAELDSLICRVKNISMVHDMLTRNTNGGNFVSLRNLIAEVLRLFNTSNVNISQQVENISIVYNKATSLAMVLNEIISNIFKHASKDVPQLEIDIRCVISEKELILTIADNGKGLPSDFTMDSTKGVGMSIIKSLVKSLNASLEMHSNHGTIATIRLLREKLSADWII